MKQQTNKTKAIKFIGKQLIDLNNAYFLLLNLSDNQNEISEIRINLHKILHDNGYELINDNGNYKIKKIKN